MITDFCKAIDHPICAPNAMGNSSFIQFLTIYYLTLTQKLKPYIDYSGFVPFVQRNYPELSEANLTLVKRIAGPHAVTNQDVKRAREYMQAFDETEILEAELKHFLAFKEPQLRDLLATKALFTRIEGESIKNIDQQMNDYRSIVKNDLLKNRFLNAYEKQLVFISKSKVSEKSILNSSASLEGPGLFNTMIEKYKGKTIYVDIWATWCAPCIAEMKDAKKLREKLLGKDVVFLYICINSPSEKRWKDLIAIHNIEGENFFLDQDQSAAIERFFNVRGIPHHALVNKDGQIVKRNAGRASDKATFDEIESLLGL